MAHNRAKVRVGIGTHPAGSNTRVSDQRGRCTACPSPTPPYSTHACHGMAARSQLQHDQGGRRRCFTCFAKTICKRQNCRTTLPSRSLNSFCASNQLCLCVGVCCRQLVLACLKDPKCVPLCTCAPAAYQVSADWEHWIFWGAMVRQHPVDVMSLVDEIWPLRLVRRHAHCCSAWVTYDRAVRRTCYV